MLGVSTSSHVLIQSAEQMNLTIILKQQHPTNNNNKKRASSRHCQGAVQLWLLIKHI